MTNRNIVTFLIFILLQLACTSGQNEIASNQSSALAERQSDLSSYYKNVLLRELPKNSLVFFIQAGHCNGCQLDRLTRIGDSLMLLNNVYMEFVLDARNDGVQKQVARLHHAKLIIDSTGSARDYGLNFGADLLFRIQDGKLVGCYDLNNPGLIIPGIYTFSLD